MYPSCGVDTDNTIIHLVPNRLSTRVRFLQLLLLAGLASGDIVTDVIANSNYTSKSLWIGGNVGALLWDVHTMVPLPHGMGNAPEQQERWPVR